LYEALEELELVVRNLDGSQKTNSEASWAIRRHRNRGASHRCRVHRAGPERDYFSYAQE